MVAARRQVDRFAGRQNIVCFNKLDLASIEKIFQRDGMRVLTADGANIVIGREEAGEGTDAEGIRVSMRYGKRGCWEAHIAPIDEDVPCPWKVGVTINKYTAVVDVYCPLGTPIRWKRVNVKSR